MLLRQLFDAASSTYTYILADERSREAVLIDPVFEQFTRDSALIRELGLRLLYTLDTHVHADHVTAAWLHKRAHGSRIVISKRSGTTNADRLIEAGEVIEFGSGGLTVRATPGHTAGCVTYVSHDETMAFTGDALLIRGAGRTDFQQGDAAMLYRSIVGQIFTLPDACYLYPAHDYAGRTLTTTAEERAFNPRVGGEANERDFTGFMENLNLPHPKQIDIAVPANLRCGRPEKDDLHAPATWGPVYMTYAGIPEIDPTWVAEHRSKLTILDVRETDELCGSERKIEGSIHVPLGALRSRIDEVPRDVPVIPVCRSGRRSAQATVILREKGIKECANLAGGMLKWHALGLPVV
ncbi:hypothetical protein AKJ09_03710 [Labilithrix luteola]|uniref:Rhodanese domain-containing protein n=1 Tax=Labilithrix luteola TaxID=1391654 RepID=A0A0K1PUJ5_9BACT|nr:MBL fold metallo-hydrolase [Labilithrix luteola]AKU97046.1 hypothetical protein AKJ09_03710 [Labilithrix luteola]